MVSDNQVWFTTGPNIGGSDPVNSGHFVVTDFKVTSGQSKSIFDGYDSWFRTSDGSGFHFGADRSASGEVADWWNNNINASSTTFNKDAGELNFAVKGTMTLWVSGGPFTDNQPVEFDNVFLAQGHSGADNNWWFGIAGATQDEEGTNMIEAMDSTGTYKVKFLRGGNFDNTVYVYLP